MRSLLITNYVACFSPLASITNYELRIGINHPNSHVTPQPLIPMRRTKIICTVGPATSAPEKLQAL
ncbi:MAG TPA: hypothetical protein VE944_04675, partial [Nostoc sp.]|uniref:hypothetical protein n=1 Tax=Nostoc sp. TaxID=1180 RepID=UPI002D454797